MSRVLNSVLLCCSASLLFPQESGLVTGKVVDDHTGAAIPGALVTVRLQQSAHGTAHGEEASLVTDTDGGFEFRHVPEGLLSVHAYKAGYLGFPGHPTYGRASAMVHLPQDQAPLMIRLTPASGIGGQVTDEMGRGIAAHVSIFSEDPGRFPRFRCHGAIRIDQSGEFRFAPLPAGRYYLEVHNVNPGLFLPGQPVYEAQFYPDKPDIRSAQPIDLTAGQGVTIQMRLHAPARGHAVRGSLNATVQPEIWMDIAGEPQVGIRSDFGYRWDQKAQTFEFSDMPRGAYTLHATWNIPMNHFAIATPVTVADEDIDGLVLQASPTNVEPIF
jgi:hypothetical protein